MKCVNLTIDNISEKITPYFRVEITGDCNDADYDTRIEKLPCSNIHDIDGLTSFLAGIANVVNFMGNHKFEKYDYDSEYGFVNKISGKEAYCMEFDMPSDSWGFAHTITNLNITYVDENSIEHPVSYSVTDCDDTDEFGNVKIEKENIQMNLYGDFVIHNDEEN